MGLAFVVGFCFPVIGVPPQSLKEMIMNIKELVAQIQANKAVETAKEESKEAKVWLNVGANITIDGGSCEW